MIERAKWIGPVFVAMALGCAVGEARPERPEGTPAEAPGRPAAAEPARPAVPPAEAARLAAEAVAAASRAYQLGDAETALDLSREVVTSYPATAVSDSAAWLAARSAFALGRHAEARDWAERHGRGQPAGSTEAERARGLAELAADGLAQPASTAPVVGALLPRTGPDVLVQYADRVLEGIQLAVREAERRHGRPIELVVADDGGGPRTAQAVAELESRGAVAVVGPLLPQQVAVAVAARSNPDLVFVSPTIADPAGHWAHVYSVAGGDTNGAQELGRYAAQRGLLEGAILHARGPDYQRRAQAFAEAYSALGGRVRTVVAYDSGTTTFAAHMQDVLRAVGTQGRAPGVRGERSFVLFVAAPDRDVPQIAPQISFYGLDAAGVQILGDHGWAAAPVRRLIPSRDLEGVVAASALPAGRADAFADPDFVTLFEGTYRRSLTNQLPALGYDAARLILEALPNRALSPAATARTFEFLTGVPGATGTLSVRGGRLVRTPHIVVIRNGQLEPVPYPFARTGDAGS